jgi:hypothetical protein
MLVSDPLSRGWNLFGTAEVAAMNVSFINYPAVIALAQAGAVVCGHLLGVISAHDRALALFPRRPRWRARSPSWP